MNKFNSIDILLVEDNPQDAELIMRTLKKNHIANEIFIVYDGEEALDFLYSRNQYTDQNNHIPKVIFLDIKLPKVNGLEILKIVKADENLRHIPVVMLTSSVEDPDIKKAYEYGANSYVVKPVDFDSFCSTINSLDMYWLVVNQSPKK
ncbi:MAG TPA: response regulator [Bacteroidales bacterium]|mgnify:CR=1 FL=1|nr:response regulator [Bacteroidales bacterium]HPS45832.1 response regulator [Bacteroidales bacterium]HQH18884.1 response regulator [Bacteroidales bacterium]HQI45436.1 response regulator [Bacteroidales bacterium]